MSFQEYASYDGLGLAELVAKGDQLAERGDCAAAIGSYQRLCANGTRCPEADLRWAENALLSTRDPDVCPVDGIQGP